MRIEILFPEVCNLFGDMSNMRYLKKCLPIRYSKTNPPILHR